MMLTSEAVLPGGDFPTLASAKTEAARVLGGRRPRARHAFIRPIARVAHGMEAAEIEPNPWLAPSPPLPVDDDAPPASSPASDPPKDEDG